jgi:hypothetical protein
MEETCWTMLIKRKREKSKDCIQLMKKSKRNINPPLTYKSFYDNHLNRKISWMIFNGFKIKASLAEFS